MTILVNELSRHALQLTDSQLGLLQCTGFAVLYCAFALPLGAVADTLNGRNLIIVGLTFWSGVTIAAAFTNSFATLFATRVLVGMGEACLIPAAMSLLATYFSPSKLARGTAIFGMGANFGYGAAARAGDARRTAFDHGRRRVVSSRDSRWLHDGDGPRFGSILFLAVRF